MNPESPKCSQIVRQIPVEQFRLPGDGRKWKQVARSRQNLLLRISTFANGDGTFERNGTNYSPSEKRITNHVNRKTYYRLSEDLRKLGWLSWTRRLKHYGRRLFTIHLDNQPETPPTFDKKQVSDSPETGDIFENEQVSHSQKTGVIVEKTHPHDDTCYHIPMMGHDPSCPNQDENDALRARTHTLAPLNDSRSANDLTPELTPATLRSAEPANEPQNSFYSRSNAAGSATILPSNQGGGTGANSDVNKNDEGALVDYAIGEPTTLATLPDEPEPTAAELAWDRARADRRGLRAVAITKSIEWGDLPKEVRDDVNAVIVRCENEWEYWATHDWNDEPLDQRRLDKDDSEIGSFPAPSRAHKPALARLLQTYTPVQILRAWGQFVRRQQGFVGIDHPWALFYCEVETHMRNADVSSTEVRHQQLLRQPPIEAFVAGLHAEQDGDSWIARCSLRRNHPHGDSNPSLVISRNDDGKVLVHCRGGCNQQDVWRAALDAAREAIRETIDKGELLPALMEAKIRPTKTFTATVEDVVAYHALLYKVPEVRAWLEKWGITPEVADKLLLGAKENVGFRVREGDHWRYFISPALCTPHADYGGQLVGLKYRAMSEKAFRQEDGSTIHGLYAMHCLDRQADEVLVLEGDKDTAIALSHGFNATCILSAQSELSDPDITLLAHYDRVYLIGDEDGGAGVEAMDKLAKRWPNDRAIRIHLPVKDVGELYAQSPAEFKDRLTAILHNTKGASA